MKSVAIVNPLAGWHRASQRWPPLVAAAGAAARHLETWWTHRPGQAEGLAARARREGFERVIAVGGDGTVLEVVNGLWWEPAGRLPSLGIVPFGTGCDYVRNFDLGRDPAENLAVALGEDLLPVAAGWCRLQDFTGKPRQRIFINVLGLGFDANLIRRFRRNSLPLRGRLPYFISGFQELLRLECYRLTGEVDREMFQDDAILAVLGLGRYFGGGLKISPGASPRGERFQVVRLKALGRLRGLGLFARLFSGRDLDHPQVRTCYGAAVRITAEPPAYIEAEGEPVGRTPLEAAIIPGAFRLAARSE